MKRTRFVLGVDLGGTKISVGAMTADGSRQLALHSQPTLAAEGADAVVGRIASMIETVMAQAMAETGATRDDFLGVGIGSPGPIDREAGLVITTPNLGWHDFPLRDRVASDVGLRRRSTTTPTARRSASGGWAPPGARATSWDSRSAPGIGGGLILEGKLYHGASDVAGEIGHTTIDSTGRRCKCGNYGCLEAYASGPAIAERAREALAGGEHSLLTTMVGGDLAQLTAATRLRGVRKRATTWPARWCAKPRASSAPASRTSSTSSIPTSWCSPAAWRRPAKTLFGPLRAEVRRRAFKPAVEACRIVPGALGGCGGRGRCGRDLSRAVLGGGVSRRKRLGVIGTFVWDVIHGRDPRDAPVEEWGGITYALGALDAALPADWELVPLVKVGDDLAPRAREFLSADCAAWRRRRGGSSCRTATTAWSSSIRTPSGAARCCPAAFPAGAGSASRRSCATSTRCT